MISAPSLPGEQHSETCSCNCNHEHRPAWQLPQTAPIPHLPAHWNNEFDGLPLPFSSFIKAVFTLVCLMAFGDPNLKDIWALSYPGMGDEVWTKGRDSLAQRISTITVVAGLILGATAAFLTTVPPVADLWNYNSRATYVCLAASFALTLGGLVVGSAEVWVMAKCSPDWFRDTLMATRLNTYCTILFVAYPFFSIGISTIVGALGLLVAARNSTDGLIRNSGIVLLLVPASLIPIFLWTQVPKRRKVSHNNSRISR